MAVKDFGTRTYLSTDEVVVNGRYARKIVKRVWVDEVNDYWYVVQAGRIEDNKLVLAEGYFTLQSFKQLTSNYKGTWTPDSSFRKGDVFVTPAGEHVVVENADGKAWRLSSGTRAKIKPNASGELTWDGLKLTMVKTIAGGRFSEYLGK